MHNSFEYNLDGIRSSRTDRCAYIENDACPGGYEGQIATEKDS